MRGKCYLSEYQDLPIKTLKIISKKLSKKIQDYWLLPEVRQSEQSYYEYKDRLVSVQNSIALQLVKGYSVH